MSEPMIFRLTHATGACRNVKRIVKVLEHETPALALGRAMHDLLLQMDTVPERDVFTVERIH